MTLSSHFSDTGVLLTNIGSPDEPTPYHVKRYLKAFLSDPRIVTLPSFLWKPLLHTFILPRRAKSSAALYQQIWTPEGSPLTVISQKIAAALTDRLKLPVFLGTHYGNPSIAHALDQLRKAHVKKIIVLPLYPQFSLTTTQSSIDHLNAALSSWEKRPEIKIIRSYGTTPDYIAAISESIKEHNPHHLLISYHGIPQKYIDRGDSYLKECEETTRLIKTYLDWPAEKITQTFQSRLGPTPWLKPYTSDLLLSLPPQGVTDVHVICPGFATECLETLEEIAIRGRRQFLSAGGKRFHYIPALNDSERHLNLLAKLITSSLGDVVT